MLLIILLLPFSMLCFYLAFLCYQKAYYRHALVLFLFACGALLLSAGLLGAGYLAGREFYSLS